MGWYGNQVLPRAMNTLGGSKSVEPLRQRACDGLAGAVVEIGFGSGPNLPFYPGEVTRVAAIEPADVGWRLARQRVDESRAPVERAGLDAQVLPLPDDSFDAALSTWTLCTVPDAHAALLELRRVLKPGGTLHFVEHGLAPDGRRTTQAATDRADLEARRRRLPPDQAGRRDADRCRVHDPRALDAFYEKGAPKWAGADSIGVAVSGP